MASVAPADPGSASSFDPNDVRGPQAVFLVARGAGARLLGYREVRLSTRRDISPRA